MNTLNTEDGKLLARRSNSLLKYITEKNEEIAQFNVEQKAEKKKKFEDEKLQWSQQRLGEWKVRIKLYHCLEKSKPSADNYYFIPFSLENEKSNHFFPFCFCPERKGW